MREKQTEILEGTTGKEVLSIASGKEAPIIQNVREWVCKNGKIRKDKLKPLIFHNNTGNGSYFAGKNAYKREKKLKQK